MGFKKEKQERIKKYILEKIENQQSDIAKRTAEAFDTSLNTVYRYIRELENDGVIIKTGNRTFQVKESMTQHVIYRSRGELKEEDRIYDQYIRSHVKDLPDNVQKIWQYSFTEMMNNAIDHSEAEVVIIMVTQSFSKTFISICDMGVGIFKKIKEYYGYESLDDAVNELFKGKLTTDSRNHSGEGIFFTSRILDHFGAISDGKIFTHNDFSDLLENIEDIETLQDWKDWKGTMILMGLSNFSKKDSAEVLNMFANVDGGFTRTHIPIKNMYDAYPVSRSQAKRLCHRFESFQEIELDFAGIQEIGQGFAHEIFVVFQNNHPEVKLLPVNMSEEVSKMVYHVKH